MNFCTLKFIAIFKQREKGQSNLPKFKLEKSEKYSFQHKKLILNKVRK